MSFSCLLLVPATDIRFFIEGAIGLRNLGLGDFISSFANLLRLSSNLSCYYGISGFLRLDPRCYILFKTCGPLIIFDRVILGDFISKSVLTSFSVDWFGFKVG